MNPSVKNEIRKASSFQEDAQDAMANNDVEKAINSMNIYYGGMKTLYDQNPNDDSLALVLAAAAGQMALFWIGLDEQKQAEEYCTTCFDINKMLIKKFPNNLKYKKGYLVSLLQMGIAYFGIEEFVLGKNYIIEAKTLADKLVKEYPPNEYLEDPQEPPISQLKTQCDMFYEKIQKIDDYMQEDKPQEEDTRSYEKTNHGDRQFDEIRGEDRSLYEKNQKMIDFSKQVDELMEEDLRLLEQNQKIDDRQVDELQKDDFRLNEMLLWEKNMTMKSVNQYINHFYYEENNENGDDILKQFYLADSNSEEIKESNKQLLNLNLAWNGLYETYQSFKNNLSCSISEIRKDDLFPYCSYNTIRKLKKELVILWLNLKQKYPQKLASVCLSDDDRILDIAESDSDSQITLLLINIVECNLELEGAYLNNNSYLIHHKRDYIEQQTKREEAKSNDAIVHGMMNDDGFIKSANNPKNWEKIDKLNDKFYNDLQKKINKESSTPKNHTWILNLLLIVYGILTYVFLHGFWVIIGAWLLGLLVGGVLIAIAKKKSLTITIICSCIFAIFTLYILSRNGVFDDLKKKYISNQTNIEQVVYDKYKVVPNILNVRSGQGTSYSVVGTLKKDEIVEALEINDKWVKISYKGIVGYVNMEHLIKN